MKAKHIPIGTSRQVTQRDIGKAETINFILTCSTYAPLSLVRTDFATLQESNFNQSRFLAS